MMKCLQNTKHVYLGLLILLLTVTNVRAQFELAQVADGVYVHHGKHEQITLENAGDIANIGFIVGEKSVAVIDTGGSRIVGESLKTAIRKITDLPIEYVILTHAHPDHIFGVQAFESEKSEIVGHKNLDNSLVQRGEFYRDRFVNEGFSESDLGLLPQSIFVESTMNLDLGNRVIELIAVETSHTNNDLVVFDETTKTIWTGDLIFKERVPVIDGNAIGWLSTMEQLEDYEIEAIVPGHGPVTTTWADALANQKRYLHKLIEQVRALLVEQGSIQDAVNTIGQDEKQSWLLFDDHHGQNVSRVYTQLEWE